MISIKFLNKFSELFLGLRMLQLCYTCCCCCCCFGVGGGGVVVGFVVVLGRIC